MTKPEHFEIHEQYASYRPVGDHSVRAAIELVTTVIAYCSKNGISRLLVNGGGLTGLGEIQVLDRYFLGEKFASAAAPGMRVVLVVDAKYIDTNKFGVTVAVNRWLQAEVFSDERVALAWLLAPYERMQSQ